MSLLSENGNLVYLIIPGIIILIVAAVFFAWLHEKKRRARLKEIADSLGFSYQEKDNDFLRTKLDQFHLFSQGHSRKIYNIMKGTVSDAEITIMDYRYTTGAGKHSTTFRQTVILFDSGDMQLPSFALRPENVFHKIGAVFGYQDIDFESNPGFSKKYLLRGLNEDAVRRTFDYEILSYCEQRKNLCLEGSGNKLIYYKIGKRIKPGGIKSFLDQGIDLFNRFR
jgi:hypothetical protein